MEKIAIIGAGNIGEALIAALVGAGTDPQTIVATNRSAERSQQLADRYGIETAEDNRQAATDADMVVLCVKPAQVPDLLDEIGEVIAAADVHTVIVSMAAGVTLTTMEEVVPAAGAPIVRVMANTPMLVGKGVLAVAYGRYVANDQREAVREVLATAGHVVEVEESQLSAVTALSGSGPRTTSYSLRRSSTPACPSVCPAIWRVSSPAQRRRVPARCWSRSRIRWRCGPASPRRRAPRSRRSGSSRSPGCGAPCTGRRRRAARVPTSSRNASHIRYQEKTPANFQHFVKTMPLKSRLAHHSR